MTEIVLSAFRGVVRQGRLLEMEKAQPSYALVADNCCFDFLGNVYVCLGFGEFMANNEDLGSITKIFYSAALDRYLVSGAGGLLVVNSDGTVEELHETIIGGEVNFADWPLTGKCYVSNGSHYWAVQVGSITALGATLGAGKPIAEFRNMVVSVGAGALSDNELMLSPVAQPTTFDIGKALKFSAGGKKINAVMGMRNTLFVHKDGTIFAVNANSPDNVSISNKHTSRGAIHQVSLCEFENYQYFVARDGFWKFNGEVVDPMHPPIQGCLTDVWDIPSDTDPPIVVPVVATTGPDMGRRYIMFSGIWNATEAIPDTWLYDVDTGDWTRRVFPGRLHAACYNPRDTKTTFTDGSPRIREFGNYDTDDGADIAGVYVTGPLDGGSRYTEKRFSIGVPFPMDPNHRLEADVDGLGFFPYNIRELPNATYEFPKEVTGYLLNLRAQRVGAGTPLLAGYALQFEDMGVTKSRDWATSRAEAVDNLMLYRPPILAGRVTLTGGEETVTVSDVIPADLFVWNDDFTMVFATWEGHESNLHLSATVNNTDVVITLPEDSTHPAGSKINWIVFLPSIARKLPIRLNGSWYLVSQLRIGGDGADDYKHSFATIDVPTAVLMTLPSFGGGAPTADLDQNVLVSNISRRGITLEIRKDVYLTYSYVAVGGADSWIRSGSLSVSTLQTTIPHGFSSSPTAVIVWPHTATVNPSYGIQQINNVNFVVESDMVGYRLDWMAVKL